MKPCPGALPLEKDRLHLASYSCSAIVTMASEADDKTKSNLEEKSHLGAKAKAHIQRVPEAMKESIPDAEDKPSNEFEEEGRIVVIAGQEPGIISDEDESVPFE